jgi:hypothetical protein
MSLFCAGLATQNYMQWEDTKIPYNGNGQFDRVYNWTDDAAADIDIRADRMDTEDNGFAAGLSIALTRDGQAPMVANLDFGGFKGLRVSAPSADTDAANKAYVDNTVAVSVAGTAIGDTPPVSPASGKLWFKTSNPVGLYIWFIDGTSSQWVQV